MSMEISARNVLMDIYWSIISVVIKIVWAISIGNWRTQLRTNRTKNKHWRRLKLKDTKNQCQSLPRIPSKLVKTMRSSVLKASTLTTSTVIKYPLTSKVKNTLEFLITTSKPNNPHSLTSHSKVNPSNPK